MTDARGRPSVDPRPDRRRRRRGVVAGVLALVVAAGSYTSLTLLGPTSPASATASTFEAPDQAAPDLAFPDYGATAVQALGYDDSLTTSGDDRPRPIASISKVVSALVVLDERPLDGGTARPSRSTPTTRRSTTPISRRTARSRPCPPACA
jgi:D-alanyl-D-alanine carboxypeptidase (penicillin-binding protein 5/6)